MSINPSAPLVSICIPVYNNKKYFKKTLESILNQTYKNTEIIIGDNASTENIEEVLFELGRENFIYFKNETNLGYAANCNRLISMAKGKYIAIYHGDDIYIPSMVKEAVKVLEQNPYVSAVFTMGKFINPHEKEIKKIKNFKIKTLINLWAHKKDHEGNIILDLSEFIKFFCKIHNILMCPTSMIRREIYEKLGGYKEELRIIEDLDMWFRILEKQTIVLINKELFKYRIHEKQGSTYYSSNNRNELLLSLEYTQEYISSKNIKLEKRLEKQFKKKIARDYNTLIKNAFLKNDFESMEKHRINSNATYKYGFLTKGWAWQNIDSLIIRKMISVYFRGTRGQVPRP